MKDGYMLLTEVCKELAEAMAMIPELEHEHTLIKDRLMKYQINDVYKGDKK